MATMHVRDFAPKSLHFRTRAALLPGNGLRRLPAEDAGARNLRANQGAAIDQYRAGAAAGCHSCRRFRYAEVPANGIESSDAVPDCERPDLVFHRNGEARTWRSNARGAFGP